ncbi:EAL domain-containing protein [Rhodospirillaceae bacterium RKSG073]|nr:EAL domain-containing protein [Curvivirga aplysinae]
MVDLLKITDMKDILQIIRNNKLISFSIFLAISCGFLVSIIAYHSIQKQFLKEDQASFIRDAEFYLKTVEKRFHTAESFIESIDRLIQMAPNLSRKDFARFNNPEDLYELGIQAVAWSPVIKHSDRASFVQQIRETGLFDFDIRDPGENYNPSAAVRFKYAPIVYVEPVHHSGHIQGLDLFAQAKKDKELNIAIDKGHLMMSDIKPLTINDTAEYGFWLHMPVYVALSNYPDIQERRQKLAGFASVAILTNDILPPPLLNSDTGFGFQVTIDQGVYMQTFSTHPVERMRLREDMMWQTIVDFAQNQVIFSFQRTEAKGISGRDFLASVVFLIGLTATLLLTSYLITSLIRTRRIEKQIQNRTKDLKISNKMLQDEIIRREKATTEQNRAELRYQRIFENAVEGIFAMGANGDILNANPSFAEIFGFKDINELKSKASNFNSLLHATDRRRLRSILLREKNLVNMECRAVNQKGNLIFLSVNATYVTEDEDVIIEGSVVDITNRKLTEAKLNDFAYLDALTNCLNRRAFNEMLENRFEKAQRYKDWAFALLFIDLDHFKMINDTQGHDVGDIVIQEVAKRLRNAIRESASIARLGGDEFAILFNNIKTSEQIHEISERILKQLAMPFETKERPFLTSGSVGIALAHGTDVKDPAQLMRNADLAMYQAKKAGRNQSIIYSEDFHLEADEKLKLQNALRKAVTANELDMVYQPVINMKSGELIATEALLRWFNPTFGQVSPDQFIPIAEQIGLISEIGAWGIDRILSDMKKIKRHDKLAHIRMNINLSPIQLCQPEFCDFLISKCEEHDIQRSSIALELTETAMVAEHINIDHYLSVLSEAGFRVLVDDFGTGYASLNQLTVTKWDGIKIDRNFVEGLEIDDNKFAITCAVLSMAETIGYEVTAEGIETEGQRDLLINMGCHIGQGYLFGKPMSVNQIIENAENDFEYTKPKLAPLFRKNM